jgi:hypothetical protein
MAEHPLTGARVEVVNAEWFKAVREALRDLLIHIPNGTALDRYKAAAYGTLGRTEFEKWERERG